MEWKREKLRVSDNKRYLMEGDKPFFWLGDTAWLMFEKLGEEDIQTYLRNRAEKGYNVIQATLVHSDRLEDKSVAEFKSVKSDEYWELVYKAVKLAEGFGMYMGLLPAWGSFVKDGFLNKDNVQAYAEFLGKKFQDCPNIIWILGGDVRGEGHEEVYDIEAETLKKYNPDRLMTFHPFGRTSSSLWFHDRAWLDFNLFQSGHRRYDQQSLGEWDDNVQKETFFGEDNWRYVDRDLSYDVKKPVLDGEPSYEGIPQGLHNPRNPFWEEWDARRYAYWSVFEGAAGHTYGSNAIMQFFGKEELVGAYGVRECWQDALHHPGSGQMQHLKNLMESVDYIHGKACSEMLAFGQKERYHRISVFAGEDFVLCYDYSGDEFMLKLDKYADKSMDAYWMNPQDGTCSYITTLKGVKKWLASPVARKDKANDWVLVLKKSR